MRTSEREHLSVRIFTFQIIKHIVCRPTCAFASLRKAAANARYGVKLAGYFLIGLGIENDSLGFALHGQHQRAPRLLHVLHQARGVALELASS